MAKPRVFISSTYYDLKHLRSSIENFVDTLGYDPVLSEKGGIAYSPEVPLDESCYREARNADIYVLIIGGRYGSETSNTKLKIPKDFYTRYESITKLEYKNASENDIPIYILIEKSVYADYENYLKNKTNTTYNYAHVDSVNIFSFIEEILSQTRNNPIYQFDKYIDIETWLREQWAGLFRELLKKLSSQSQMTSLSAQVGELAEINRTLKRYLETVMTEVGPSDSSEIIRSESKRLDEAKKIIMLRNNRLVDFLVRTYDLDLFELNSAISEEPSLEALTKRLLAIKPSKEMADRFESWKNVKPQKILNDFEEAKKIASITIKDNPIKKVVRKKVKIENK